MHICIIFHVHLDIVAHTVYPLSTHVYARAVNEARLLSRREQQMPILKMLSHFPAEALARPTKTGIFESNTVCTQRDTEHEYSNLYVS